MAGIGFELQRVLKRGGMVGAFKAALAGIIIVAGPWLVSILGISFLYQISSTAFGEHGMLFTAAVVYSYAFSLFLFGGFHYIFTRYIADLIYVKENGRALGALVLAVVLVGILSAVPALVTVSFLDLKMLQFPGLYKSAAVLLFVTISLISLVMIFITLLKRYVVIFLIYLTGMAVSVFSAYFLGRLYSISGALAGFSLGHIFILVFLLILLLTTIDISPPLKEFTPFLAYFRKYLVLFLTGIFYAAGIWSDKILLWFIKGDGVEGTFLHMFAPYDMPVYLANLTIIPGLVYFMIYSESNFYIALKKVLLHLGRDIESRIKQGKYILYKTVKSSLREQSLFQGVITLVLIIIAPDIKALFLSDAVSVLTFRITLTALFFNLLLLTTVTFLFYIEKYKSAFFSVMIFFSVNVGVTLYSTAADFPYYGGGYLVSCAVGTIAAFIFLRHGIKYIDRDIFAKY